jgi:sec-independent protein translocase protein TatA
MPFGLGFGELILIFAVLLLVFGARRLPEIGGAMGKSIRDFKRTLNGLDETPLESSRTPQQVSPPQEQPAQPAPAEPQPAEERRPS